MSAALVLSITAAMAITRSSASMVVTATNVPYLRSTVAGDHAQVLVTEDDIRAGYVDVAGPEVGIRTNDPRGYVVVFRLAAGPFDAVTVSGLSREVEAGPGGAFVSEPRTSIQTTLHLRYRLRIAQAATPGGYAMPVAVSICRPNAIK